MPNSPQPSSDPRPNIPPTENYDTAAVPDRAAPYGPEDPEFPPQVVPPVVGGGSPVHLDVDEPLVLEYNVFPPGSVEAQHGSSSGSGSRAPSREDSDGVAIQAAMLDFLSIDENIPPERVTSADYDQMFASALHTRMEGLETSGVSSHRMQALEASGGGGGSSSHRMELPESSGGSSHRMELLGASGVSSHRMQGLEASGGGGSGSSSSHRMELLETSGSSSSQYPAAEEIDEQSLSAYRAFTDLPLCSDCREPMRRIRSLEPRGFSAYTNTNLCRNCIDRRGQERPDFMDHSYPSLYYEPHNSPSVLDRIDSVGPSIPFSLDAPGLRLVPQVSDEPTGSMIFGQTPNFLQVSPDAAAAFHAAGAGEYNFQPDSRRDSTGSASSPVRHNLRSPSRQSPYSTQRRSPGGRLPSVPDIADPNQSRSPDVLTALVNYNLSHSLLLHDDPLYSQSKNSTILRNLVQLRQNEDTRKSYTFVHVTNKHKAEKLTYRNVHEDLNDSLGSCGVSFDSTSDECDEVE